MADLLGCPFCGGLAIRQVDGSGAKKKHAYRCDNDECLVEPVTLEYESIAEARAAWNRRATPAAGMVEARLKPVLAFLDRIEGHRYGGEADFENARGIIQALAATTSSNTDTEGGE